MILESELMRDISFRKPPEIVADVTTEGSIKLNSDGGMALS